MSLEEIANYIVSDGKGILAADESNPTCGKRFDSIEVENSENNRRDYREMLFRSKGMKGNIGGVILFDETLRQDAKDGTSLKELIINSGALPGIKVDKGLVPLVDGSDEVVTQGLDGLDERCSEYDSLGAKFTKWRAVIKIGDSMPSDDCINANAKALADYAAIAQSNNMVPIVEPEVLMDGDHTIETCYEVSEKTLKATFKELENEGVYLPGILLKPNMVISGSECKVQGDMMAVAEMTVKCLTESVPAEVPGIVFLSGGQSEVEATEHLNAMNKMESHPWALSFSYGRALQQSALKTWNGQKDNLESTYAVFHHRAEMNSLACSGEYSSSLEI